MGNKKDILVVVAIILALTVSMGYTVRRYYGEALQDIVLIPEVITIADNGASFPDGVSEYTISSPTRSNYPMLCPDTDGCDVFVGETFGTDVPRDGRIYTFSNRSANAIIMRDESGILELAGDFTFGQYDTLTCKYDSDRLVEIARSNN